MNDKLKFDYILYHSPCPDGHYSAWVPYNLGFPKEQLVPMAPGKYPSVDVVDKNIMCMDYCPPLEFLNNAKFNSCLVLDHHKTGMEILEKVNRKEVTNIMDMTRSGCQITWDYYHKDDKRPLLLDYVADRDLWKWKLDDSKEINTAIDFNGIELDKIDTLMGNVDLEYLKTMGKIIVQINNKEMDTFEKSAVMAECNGYKIWLCDSPLKLRSDMGNRLVNKCFPDGTRPAFSAIWSYNLEKNEWWISLRGAEDSIDLTTIAKKYGGGGHPKACGMTIKSLSDAFNWNGNHQKDDDVNLLAKL